MDRREFVTCTPLAILGLIFLGREVKRGHQHRKPRRRAFDVVECPDKWVQEIWWKDERGGVLKTTISHDGHQTLEVVREPSPYKHNEIPFVAI